MGKLFGGSSTSSVKIPEYIEDASKQNLALAQRIAQIGYTPYYGPDVAAFTPMQEAAFSGANNMASAFGMPTGGSGMPQAQTFAGGVRGYSSAPIMQEAIDALKTKNPDQYKAIRAVFDTLAAQQQAQEQAEQAAQTPQTPQRGMNDGPEGSRRGWNDGPGGTLGGGGLLGGGNAGGYENFRDMINGGGPGASGGLRGAILGR